MNAKPPSGSADDPHIEKVADRKAARILAYIAAVVAILGTISTVVVSLITIRATARQSKDDFLRTQRLTAYAAYLKDFDTLNTMMVASVGNNDAGASSTSDCSVLIPLAKAFNDRGDSYTAAFLVGTDAVRTKLDILNRTYTQDPASQTECPVEGIVQHIGKVSSAGGQAKARVDYALAAEHDVSE